MGKPITSEWLNSIGSSGIIQVQWGNAKLSDGKYTVFPKAKRNGVGLIATKQQHCKKYKWRAPKWYQTILLYLLNLQVDMFLTYTEVSMRIAKNRQQLHTFMDLSHKPIQFLIKFLSWNNHPAQAIHYNWTKTTCLHFIWMLAPF